MSQKKCKKCGTILNKEAEKCPVCGATNKKKSSLFLIIIIGLLILYGIGKIIEFSDETNWKEKNNWIMSYIMMEDFVKQRLKSPKSADFPGVYDNYESHIKYLGNQRYKIDSWVDSQNSFGAMIRTYFVGEIKQTSAKNWKLISLYFK